ncbi:MAG: hypothetical protein M1548_07655 [Actinobacteria bacterium]|nr:hypothetical protein [Actinomycetota bacterium]
MKLRGRNRSFGSGGQRQRWSGTARFLPTIFALSLAVLEAAAALTLGKAELVTAASQSSAFKIGPLVVLGGGVIRRIIPASSLYIELVRETAIAISIISVAMLAGRDRIERVAAFFWSFGVFVVASYAARFLFSGTPPSLTSMDVLVLLPRSLLLPVYLPIGIAFIMIAIAAVLYALRGSRHVGRLTF